MSFQALLYSAATIGKKDTRMWRLRGFRASLLTASRLQHAGKKRRMMESGGEERKVRGAIKKQVGSEAIYPEILCSLVTINVRGFCTAFLRRNATEDRLIVAPDYDDLRKSTWISKRRRSLSRAIDGACDLPLYFGQVAVFTVCDLRVVPVSRTGRTQADECAIALAPCKKRQPLTNSSHLP
jgi:hypothetical protein